MWGEEEVLRGEEGPSETSLDSSLSPAMAGEGGLVGNPCPWGGMVLPLPRPGSNSLWHTSPHPPRGLDVVSVHSDLRPSPPITPNSYKHTRTLPCHTPVAGSVSGAPPNPWNHHLGAFLGITIGLGQLCHRCLQGCSNLTLSNARLLSPGARHCSRGWGDTWGPQEAQDVPPRGSQATGRDRHEQNAQH